jgi:hypothetical protein
MRNQDNQDADREVTIADLRDEIFGLAANMRFDVEVGLLEPEMRWVACL